MSRLVRRALLGVVLGALIYLVAVLYVDIAAMRSALADFRWSAVGLALLLSSVNYLLRFWKWELCLGWLGIREPGPGNAPGLTRGRSLLIYIAGLSMSVTPGKVGEVLRSLLLKQTDGVAFTRTAPVVVADRLTDLVALVVLSLVGIMEFQEYLPVVLVTLALVVAGVIVLGSPRLCHGLLHLLERLPGVGRLATKAEALVDASARLLRLRALVVLSILSIVGWGLECVGYWLILRGFAGADATLALATFLWSTTTLIGALSFLPGGLGATEGSLAVLVARLATGVTQAIALASTLLIRACTLWFGELVGGVALAWLLHRYGDLDDAAKDAPSGRDDGDGDDHDAA
ncbi:MAG: flippase-like domain-containing protein [Myxococcales bacterium]|nr:flippase-like domain-containing protein [Myxococcales bacterium]